MASSPPSRSSSSSPPKQHSNDAHHKLVNRLGLATLSLRPRWRVMVLGHQSVGKSAFVVRYLTRRFIGDYDPQLERCFPMNATIHGDHVLLELLDSGGHHLEDGSQSELEAKIRWADAFVLMYSVTDKCSFDECCRLRFLIGYNKRRRRHLFGSTFGNSHNVGADVLLGSCSSSVALVANKIDQVEDRMVTAEEGEKRSRDLGCDLFYEISVREEVDIVKKVIDDLYSRWKYNQHHHNHHPAPQHPLSSAAETTTPPTPNGTSAYHFGRRCLETFTGKCSANKSNSMDVISERDDGALPTSISLGDRITISPQQEGSTGNSTPPDGKFRSRASTEGSLSYRIKRPFGHHLRHVQPLVIDQPQTVPCQMAAKNRPVRRMSISLRGTNSAF